MSTDTASATRNRFDTDTMDFLVPDTATSLGDVVGTEFGSVARRRAGRLVCTRRRQQDPTAVKWVYLLPGPLTQAKDVTLVVEAEEDVVGTPGGTAASLVSWPELWTHPEESEISSGRLFQYLVFAGGESDKWSGVVHGLVSSSQSRAVTKRFTELLAEWQKDTQLSSDTDEICTHAAYQQIIGMGPLALPLIFREMQKEIGPWFWALKAITGADPVPVEDVGRVRKMTQHWLAWARSYGYVR